LNIFQIFDNIRQAIALRIAIYGNDFELAKILIDDGKVNVNIKNDCGDTPFIAVCQQRTLHNEEEAVMFV
jgi:ankyrin repeat protein